MGKRYLLALLLSSCLCFAAESPTVAEDPVLEKRVFAISEELRCLVCQNQTIADSHAELAVDLKNQVRTMLKAGRSEAEIKQYMVDRYGDFVLYRPPVKGITWMLWVGPFLLLLVGILFLGFKLRQRSRRVAATDAAMTEQDVARAESLLGNASDKPGSVESNN